LDVGNRFVGAIGAFVGQLEMEKLGFERAV
jgi:hypothetical protein